MKVGLGLVFLLWALTASVSAQGNTCYANCKQGYCLAGNALACTDCDLGLVNINSMCIGGSVQAPPATYLKPSAKGLADALAPLNCSVRTPAASTPMVFEPTIGTTFTRSFALNSLHIYTQLKFNAIIAAAGTAPSSPTLLLTVFTAAGQTIYTTVKSFNSSGNPVTCSGNYLAYDVFNSNEKFASSESSILVEVRASGISSAKVALSDFEIYFGNCSQQCGQCFGPTEKECLSCRGLLATLTNSQCASCNPGFYQGQAGGICMACPVECTACSAINGQVQCSTCNAEIAFSVDPSISLLGCQTNYSKLVDSADQNFANSSWVSSETAGNTVTTCGFYSLVGGISIGVAGSSLLRSFTSLPAHTTLYLYFTLFLIDQAVGDFNGFQANLDGNKQPVSLTIAAPQGATLTNECGTSALEMAVRQSFQFTHNASSATLILTFLKDYVGIRDITLVVNNKTSVADCYSESNSSCAACRYGRALVNNSCGACADGYYLEETECLVCPITCKTCAAGTGQPVCLSCWAPLVLDGTFCVDASQALFATDVYDNITSPRKSWSLYPNLQNGGLTTCKGTPILGSSDIKFKFLRMKRTFKNLPTHSGVAVAFQFYQIDDYADDDSVKFTLNNITTVYRPSNLKMDLCGNSSPDAIVPVYLSDPSHSASTLDFQVSIDRMGKLGIRNLMVFLLNTAGGAPTYSVDIVPTYSVNTPPVKGLTARLLFSQPFTLPKNETDYIFNFAIKSSSGRLLQVGSGGVLLDQNSSTNSNKELLYLLQTSSDYSDSQLQVRAGSPSSLYFSDGNGNNNLLTQQLVTATVPRYIEMNTDDVADRSSCRNLNNLFRGCAILGLFIGMASFLVGMSAAFDDFLLLCQLIFVHVFIQLDYNPPSVRVPFEGLHIVQFLEWLPWEARQAIERGIIPGDLYQQSPLVYQQYYQDIVFARTIYQPLLFLALMVALWAVMHVVLGVWDSKNPTVKYSNYLLYYYQRYNEKQVALIDKMVRFAYFPIVWACVLQCTHLTNSPKSFNVWNSALTIIFFIGVFAYPAVMFYFFWKRSSSISTGTFHKRYEEVRIDPDRLFYFLVRYYKLVAIACIIGFLHAASPIIPLIVLIAVNLGDGVLLIFLKPLGMVQAELIEATTFFPRYPTVYHFTMVIQQAMFVILEILFLVLYGQRTGQSAGAYMGIGYAICVVVILLLLNGLLRLFWGFMKQAQHCYLERETLEQSIEKELEENKDPVETHPIMENVMKSQANVSQRELSRLNSKKMSFVSKIR